MRLRRPCQHGRYETHPTKDGPAFFETCPGGEFLPEDAVVIEKDGLRCRDCGQRHETGAEASTCDETIAGQVGEPR